MNILQKIADGTRERYAVRKGKIPLEIIKRRALESKRSFTFGRAIAAAEFAVIAEIKKASPSKGIISPDFPYMEQAEKYAAAGADAISCLTEPRYFLGSDEIFSDIRKNIALPMLRKDFTVDEYQIYESAVLGADCVLLITSLLADVQLKDYLQTARGLGLDCLVECRDEGEIERALKADAGIIGVNNRNLSDFSVDEAKASRLRSLVPEDKIFISESGILSPEQALAAKAAGANGCLIGEALMRGDPADFIGKIKNV